MANKYFNPHRMSPIQEIVWQVMSIRNTYSNIESLTKTKNSFRCIMSITPSENSDPYRVEISYRCGGFPRAIVLSPEIQKKDGNLPHHIYGTDKNGHIILCVFHPGSKEWNNNMLISKTFIPWVSTWLNTYEYWLITGEWHYDEIISGKQKSN